MSAGLFIEIFFFPSRLSKNNENKFSLFFLVEGESCGDSKIMGLNLTVSMYSFIILTQVGQSLIIDSSQPSVTDRRISFLMSGIGL